MELRDYQERMLEETRAHIRAGRKRILLVLPTGGGKTVISAFMAKGIAERRKSVWFNCHRDFLVEQTRRTYENVGLATGLIVAGMKSVTNSPVQVCSVQTLVRRLAAIPLPDPDVCIWDEAHHAVAGSWDKIISHFPNAIHIGVTATPERLDGRGLDSHFDVMVLGPTVKELMKRGALSPFRAWSVPPHADLKNLKKRGGDFKVEEMAALLDQPDIVGDLVDHWKKHANGLRSVYFGITVEHSKHIAEAFNAAGIPARHLDADSSPEDRSAAARDLATGALSVLTNCYLFGEGYDLSAQAGMDVTVDCVGLARPTASLTLYLQQVGRGLRPRLGKCAVILDHAGNILRHGLPDADRSWSLAGKSVTNEQVWQCPECYGVNPAAVRTCEAILPETGDVCGAKRPVAPKAERGERQGILQAQGDLIEVTADDVVVQMYREQDKKRRLGKAIREAKSYEDLAAIAKQFGYKPGWAHFKWQAIQQHRGRRSA